MSNRSTPPGTGRKLALVVLGLAALITTMLCAFALPSLHSGPHHVPLGVTGPRQTVEGLRDGADADAWDVRVYATPAAVRSAVEDRAIAGGLAVTDHGVDVYTATAGGPPPPLHSPRWATASPHSTGRRQPSTTWCPSPRTTPAARD